MYREVEPVFVLSGNDSDPRGAVAVSEFDGNVSMLVMFHGSERIVHAARVVMTARQAMEMSASLDHAVGYALGTTERHVRGVM